VLNRSEKSGIGLSGFEGFIVTNNKGLRIVLGLQGYERVAVFQYVGLVNGLQ